MNRASIMRGIYQYILLVVTFIASCHMQEVGAEDGVFFLDIPKNCTEEAILSIEKQIDSLIYENTLQALNIRLSSTTGTLQSYLRLAQKIALLRDRREVDITVYIDTFLKGPLALLPYGANRIKTTQTVTWGSPFSTDKEKSDDLVLAKSVASSLMQKLKPDQYRAWKAILDRMTDTSFIDFSTQYFDQTDLSIISGIEVEKETQSFDMVFKTNSTGGAIQVEEGAIPNSGFEKIVLTPHSFIGRITIGPKNDMISQSTWIYVKAALDYFKVKKPSCIIIELDTPGGEVFAAEKISDALKSIDYDYGIPVIAYINNWAISAGAMISYSCRYIIAEQDGAMGAATPVMMTSEGVQPTSEKMVSALRADFANKATLFGRNPYIAEAMVDPDTIIVNRGGEIIKLSTENEIKLASIQEGNDTIISAKGKLLTLTGADLAKYSIADCVIPIGGKKGFISNTSIENSFLQCIPYFQSHMNIPIETFEMDAKTSFISFIASPMITSGLVFVLMIAVYMELSAPGITFPGIIAFISFFLLMLGSYAQESIAWFEPLIAVFGVILIILDVLILPTGGLIAGVGVVCTCIAIILMIIPAVGDIIAPILYHSEKSSEIEMTIQGYYGLHVLSLVSVAICIALATIILLAKYQIHPRFLRKTHIVLEDVPCTDPIQDDKLNAGKKNLQIGDEAIVYATLRPSGKVSVEGELFHAISSGEFIQADERVRIVDIRGNMVCVEKMH